MHNYERNYPVQFYRRKKKKLSLRRKQQKKQETESLPAGRQFFVYHVYNRKDKQAALKYIKKTP
jgi:hypothetical protein